MAVAWDDDYSNQLSIMNQINGRIAQLERQTIPATYIGTSLPDQTAINLTWDSLGEGSAPLHSKTQWYDPVEDKIKNIMMQLDGTIAVPLQKPSENVHDIIGEFKVEQGDTPVTFWQTPDFDKDYTSVLVIGSVKTTDTAAGRVIDVRANGNSAINAWYQCGFYLNQTPAWTFTGFNPTTLLRLGIAQDSNAAAIPYQFTHFTLELFHPYSERSHSFFWNSIWSDVDLSLAGYFGAFMCGGQYRQNTIIDNLFFFLNAGNFAVGSKITVFGTSPV